MNKVRITHPDIEGSEVEVPEQSLPHHRAAGWVLMSEVQAAGGSTAGVHEGTGKQPDTEAPQGRRSTKKDGGE